MSKKTQQIKHQQKTQYRQRAKKIMLQAIIGFTLLLIFYYGYQKFFSTSAKVANSCLNNKDEAIAAVKQLPEVKKYLSGIKNDIAKPYFQIDVNFAHKNETRFGYAYVGKKSENNSIFVKYKYLFSTGCNFQFQKETNDYAKSETPITFTYFYKMAQIDYYDQTSKCIKSLSKSFPVDFDKDGNDEYLLGCYKGGTVNYVDYRLYKNIAGQIHQIDSFKSSGTIEKIADINHDYYYDISNPGFLIDEGQCKDDGCLAPYKPGEAKILLKRSYQRLWNPKTSKFNPPLKAEIYYFKGDKKIILSNS